MTALTSKRPAWIWLSALAVATMLLYVLVKDMDWNRVGQELRNISLGWVALAVLFNFAILALWSVLWSVFLPRRTHVPYSNVFEVIALMAMVLNTVPYMAGHASGVLLLARRGKVGHTVALSVLALDQLVEGLAKLSVLLLVAVFIPLPDRLRQGIIGLVGGVGLLLVVLFWFSHRHREFAASVEHKRSWRIETLRHYVAKWAHHLEALRSPKVLSTALLLALAIKGAEVTAILLVQRSFGLDLPMWSGLLILASVGLATMVAVAPANLGVYEATVFIVYRYLGATPEQALGLALLQHLCFLIPMVGTGYFLILFRNVRRPEPDHSFAGTRLPDEA